MDWRQKAYVKNSHLYGIGYHNGYLYSIQGKNDYHTKTEIIRFKQHEHTFISELFASNNENDQTNPKVRKNPKFNQLHFLTCTSNFLYVSDYYNYAVHQLDINDGSLVESYGNGQFNAEDGTASQTRFKYPRTLTCDNQGNVYVLDYIVQTIRKISNTGISSTIIKLGGSDETKGVDFYDARLAYDNTRNVLYLTIGRSICSITLDGQKNIWPREQSFGFLQGICVDKKGMVYVTDSQKKEIYEVNPDTKLFRKLRLHVPETNVHKLTDLVLDDEHSLYVLDYHGLYKFCKIPEWKYQRLFWIAVMKNSRAECPIANLPRELVFEVLKFM